MGSAFIFKDIFFKVFLIGESIAKCVISDTFLVPNSTILNLCSQSWILFSRERDNRMSHLIVNFGFATPWILNNLKCLKQYHFTLRFTSRWFTIFSNALTQLKSTLYTICILKLNKEIHFYMAFRHALWGNLPHSQLINNDV